MQVAATTPIDLVVHFSLIIGIGVGTGVCFVGLWHPLLPAGVDSQAEVVSEAPANEVWSRNADSNASAWQTFCTSGIFHCIDHDWLLVSKWKYFII